MMRRTTTAACALAFAVAVSACEREPLEPQVDRSPAGAAEQADPATAERQADEPGNEAEQGGETRVADIVGEPESYVGKTVTVSADVEEVFGPMAFALDEDSPLTGGIDNDLLVLSKKAGALEEIDDQWLDNKVRVTGTVGTWGAVEVEREIGWDLDPEIEVELENGGPVLIATSVERIPD